MFEGADPAFYSSAGNDITVRISRKGGREVSDTTGQSGGPVLCPATGCNVHSLHLGVVRTRGGGFQTSGCVCTGSAVPAPPRAEHACVAPGFSLACTRTLNSPAPKFMLSQPVCGAGAAPAGRSGKKDGSQLLVEVNNGGGSKQRVVVVTGASSLPSFLLLAL